MAHGYARQHRRLHAKAERQAQELLLFWDELRLNRELDSEEPDSDSDSEPDSDRGVCIISIMPDDELDAVDWDGPAFIFKTTNDWDGED